MSHRFVRHIQQRARASSSDWVVAAEDWLDAHSWALVVGIIFMMGCWIGAFAVGDAEASPTGLAAAGLLALTGGLVEIFLSRPLGELHLRGRFGTEISANEYRFWGSVVVGIGCGLVSYAVAPNDTAAIVVGLVTGAAAWMWTWFAFPVNDDDQ